NFFSCLKCECTNFYHFRNRDEAKQTIFEYIEIYYNRQRRHSAVSLTLEITRNSSIMLKAIFQTISVSS
ncbi:MAG: IS3 family transposase, partial [Clostridia bacterium]